MPFFSALLQTVLLAKHARPTLLQAAGSFDCAFSLCGNAPLKKTRGVLSWNYPRSLRSYRISRLHIFASRKCSAQEDSGGALLPAVITMPQLCHSGLDPQSRLLAMSRTPKVDESGSVVSYSGGYSHGTIHIPCASCLRPSFCRFSQKAVRTCAVSVIGSVEKLPLVVTMPAFVPLPPSAVQ
jgi:hypothetical protein